MTRSTLLDRVRQPEYTGENRCVPCTVVNVLIAAATSLVLGIVWVPLGLVSFVVFAGVIYTRGYLVPGTPTLTKRYLPDRVLRWFDKEPTPRDEVGVGGDAMFDTGDETIELDVEAVLQGARALEQCEDVDDLCLTDDFETAWTREIQRTDDAVVRRRLAAMLGIDADRISLADRGRWFVANVGGTYVGRWESHGALVADVAADTVLEDRIDDWDALANDHRSALARGIRVYLDQCPDCGGAVQFNQETAESCCRSWDVLVTRCDDCGSRLFEVDLSTVEEAPA
ncbi:hypothetical protein GJR96_11595 [Haloferax sp. MBLA0076]|uniref:Uncharacterized protein n=1 Tax=Haloferax litoreum TaxID=2666140 RepID=A0A6A8GHE0_9EURY|nr:MULTISPECIES: hypothetical protein [Haloferax]KAB1194046.1 hypothetical protein Hfx1148_11545 [Haloferax sp. CBA1148]MRX22595.1 hypothetical protein [Haloferax litoreum]